MPKQGFHQPAFFADRHLLSRSAHLQMLIGKHGVTGKLSRSSQLIPVSLLLNNILKYVFSKLLSIHFKIFLIQSA